MAKLWHLPYFQPELACEALNVLGGQAGELTDRNFIEFSYVTSETGRNLAIDRFEIDGVANETENAAVLSTGIYNSSGQLVPGFQETEIMQTNGYFPYAEPA